MCACAYACVFNRACDHVFRLLDIFVWMFSNMFVSMYCTLIFCTPLCVFSSFLCVFSASNMPRHELTIRSRDNWQHPSQSAPLTAIENALECFFLEPSWRSWLSRSPLAPTCCAFELSTVENIFAASPAKCDRKSSIELEVGCWLADIWISIFR